MCEPAHSIIQFTEPKDSDGDESSIGRGLTLEERVRLGLGKLAEWGSKIKHWINFSRLGSGHSEGAADLNRKTQLALPPFTSYEGFWWSREFKTDGNYKGYDFEKSEALAVAKEYHERVVFASIGHFRRFLEQSLRKTNKANSYVTNFVNSVLNPKGQDTLAKRMKRFGIPRLSRIMSVGEPEINTIIGVTRDRKLFMPHFADDDKLWTPKLILP